MVLQDGQLHKNYATSMDIWEEQMKQVGENNPVIYYKKQGEYWYIIYLIQNNLFNAKLYFK